MWGGCGDNVKYSLKFTRRFLKSRGSSNDLRGQMDLHNSKLGMKVIDIVHSALKVKGFRRERVKVTGTSPPAP